MMRKLEFFVVTVVFLLACAPRSFADDNQRIEQLEREVRELRSIVNGLVEENKALKASVNAVHKTAPAPAPVAAVPGYYEDRGMNGPKLEIHGFGNIQYDYSKAHNSDSTKGDTNYFSNGAMDLFITSQVSDRISFLSETGFEFDTDGSTGLDVERLLLKYEVDDWLNISIGRGHTALGYWNQTFHHGKWLYTTVDRPTVFRWEDEGGIMPVHYVGLEFSGTVEAAGGSWRYISNLANGRGTITDQVQVVLDRNDSKMSSFQFTYEPNAIEGLGIGANVLYDLIPKDPSTTGRNGEINELIYGAHTVYTLDPYELIMEASVIDHYNHATNTTDKTVGGYGQIAYKIDKFKPYLRYDWLRIADRDPFFAGAVEDESTYTAGVRYELTPFNALKLEYRHVDMDTVTKNEATIQSSFAF